MTPQELAQLSNTAVAATIVVFSLAIIVYAVCAAIRRTQVRRAATHPAEQLAGHPAAPVAVPAGVGTGDAWPPAPLAGAAAPPPADRRFLDRLADVLVGLGTLLLGSALLLRGLSAGRPPWGTMYEFTLAATFAASVVLCFCLRSELVRALAAWVVAIIVLALGLAVAVLYSPAGNLVPVLDSYWLVIHVSSAILGGGIFTLGFVVSVAYLVRSRQELRRPELAATATSAARLDRLAYTLYLVAFPIWTFAVIAGAIWAENAWGRYWGWDPKETWAFITWVFYAAYLHAQATPRWRGTRASVVALLGYAAFLFNFFGVNLWISGLHSYAGV
ncbi:c-type cytochrome biogenesis protein CcsB [Nocardioides hungaricus]